MTLNEVSRLYSVKNIAARDQHIKDYIMQKPLVKTRGDGSLLVALLPEDEKNKKSFITMSI